MQSKPAHALDSCASKDGGKGIACRCYLGKYEKDSAMGIIAFLLAALQQHLIFLLSPQLKPLQKSVQLRTPSMVLSDLQCITLSEGTQQRMHLKSAPLNALQWEPLVGCL